jgi:fructose-bisphosphate aldolase class II
MTRSTTRELVERAVAAEQAVLAFNVITLEHAEAVIAGAERAHADVLLQVSERAIGFHHGKLAPLLTACANLADQANVRIAIHLDHFQDVTLAEHAITTGKLLGVSSIMLDFARYPHIENVRLTRELSIRAQAEGLWVEAELGEIGGKDGAHAPGVRTDPGEAIDFVSQTGVDALAVAVGSSHAMTSREAELDIGLIAQLAAAVPVPLVLHGSSGVADVMIREAIVAGIRKVNVGTALNIAFTEAIRAFLVNNPGVSDPRPYLSEGREAISQTVAGLCGLAANPVREQMTTPETVAGRLSGSKSPSAPTDNTPLRPFDRRDIAKPQLGAQ